MEQNFSQQDVVLGWTQASILPGELSVAPLHSASSAVISPACGDSPSNSSGQSTTSLKEWDYIGLAEVSSAPPPDEPKREVELNLAETDLRLGLGPSTDTSSENLERKDRVALPSSHAMDVCFPIRDEAKPLSSSTWQSLPPKTLIDSMATHQSSVQLAMAKNGGKRLYAETMIDAYVSSTAVLFNTNEPRSSANPIVSSKQPQDPEVKPFLQGSQEEVQDEAPPAKGQVVGWPPVRSYRRSTLAARLKPVWEEGDSSQLTIYVKVNMDGIPIGRKVDLSTYKSYDGLLSALEDMFRNPNGGYGAQFLKGSEFVLTYEDKEGDWMLVGDVPWSMFINTVRRLRITRGPDMACLGSRTSACHA
ncbi:hypothetical protein GOP47_0018564 [Adiantum capillus-veneris]|uniref:Auxin-responsive protein n=1 Tax=Adiantum capillus-veneris TaxID=13818 RepID=A0A9D4UDS5_ADICA|nr:hypothetical protein GOP47_0018564 [Adiantum capillus-veneris]